jgi:hypothetical protein
VAEVAPITAEYDWHCDLQQLINNPRQANTPSIERLTRGTAMTQARKLPTIH